MLSRRENGATNNHDDDMYGFEPNNSLIWTVKTWPLLAPNYEVTYGQCSNIRTVKVCDVGWDVGCW